MANNFENIDRYFGGEMNADEMHHFESVIKQDPLLEKEFTFQQELVDGLQAARRVELKATLSNVDVTGVSALESGALTKILGGIAIAGMVTVGAYLYFGEEEVQSMETSTQEVISAQETTEELPTASTEKGTPEDTALTTTDNTVTEENTALEVVAEKSIEPVEISKANVTESFEDEEEASETEAPENHLITKSKVTVSSLDVTIENSKKYSFHYQVKNNALSLYGDFSKLYDIIEFHKDGNTKTYFKYEKKYYEIDKLQSKATPLIELTGDALHNLLDSIENNKER